MEKPQLAGTVSSRKRRRGEKMLRFDNFCEPGQPMAFSTGSFQENIGALLVAFGHSEAEARQGIQCWSFQLELHRHPSACVSLFVAEEAVGESLCRRCRLCQSVGWGHHMICSKRYHFVLPYKGTKPDAKSLSSELGGNGSKMVGSRGQYLMHGVMHSNGFGHLIAVNGIDGGSELVTGHQILGLWDRICTALRARKVSITDGAKKGGMELRLIHGLAYGQPWFAHWGYKFGHGSYGVTSQMYQTSLEAIRTLPLFLLVPHFACVGREIPAIVSKYQTLSGHGLLTLSDLVRFMIELNRRLPPAPPTALDYRGVVAEPTCRWSMKRVEMATQVIVGALEKSGLRWVTRQEVRDAARAHIGDTGLLDYVLKSLGNHVVGRYVVRRMVNPITKVLEYCLQDASSALGPARFQVSRAQLMRDMLYLYSHVLRAQSGAVANGVFGAIPMAVGAVLDAKHLVKDYGEGPPSDAAAGMKLMCTVRLAGDDQEKKEPPPCEAVVLEPDATVGDLKREGEKRFRGLYWGLKGLEVESVAGVGAGDCEPAVGVFEHGSRLVLEGRIDGECDVYEGGRDVDCHCGAREDDGEQMACCDICEIWQHARCAGVVGGEGGQAHGVFLCNRCEDNIASLTSIQY